MNKLLLLAATGVLWSEVAVAQTTGRGALTALTRDKGGGIASQVVLVSGQQGQDQPGSWRLVTRDPEFAGRFHEYIVRKDKVVQATVLDAAGAAGVGRAPLVAKRIRFDSSLAFMKADEAARKALVGFDSLDYELRNKELSQDPVWVVRLRDTQGAAAGELIISAESGAVLRKTWYDASRQPEAAGSVASGSAGTNQSTGTVSQPTGGQPAAGAVGQKAQQLWDGTRQGIEQGKEVVKAGFQKAGTNVRGWINRLRGGTSSASEPGAWETGTYDSSRP